ncbi:Aste57867_13960 [Aphanomyces stellatus]|uniref:Crossover junction endonuclease MUS81 n=1 Tax=Aphanomyces stellatus TaxID=120398 RepID=A0A485KZZ4_9STRA|nr:hypothetical protein As57867_013909 [Aphanomyces stellatus]VFT90790.1 Aste57867_13960 [Aphanomyces stellatus]
MPPKCANPANEFLAQEMEKLIERDGAKTNRRGPPGQVNHAITSYQRALYSIRLHPEYIESGEQAKALKGIGNFIAQKINAILIRLEAAAMHGEAAATIDVTAPTEDMQPKKPASKKRKAATTNEGPRMYKPAKGKQPWYVLMALWEMVATTEGRAVDAYALWTHMKELGFDGERHQVTACLSSLINAHHVVGKRVDDGKLYLTLDGIQSATECRREYLNAPCVGTTAPSTTSELQDQSFDWSSTNLSKWIPPREPPRHALVDGDQWEIVLLLDHREMISRSNRSVFERKLLEAQVTCEVRSLGIGDMIWIARSPSRLHKGDECCGKPEEFVLDVVVERKNVSDLASSIIDKRYTEQKARLKDCGLRYVIYLVEGTRSLSSQATCIRGSSLQTALTRTQVQNNFLVFHGSTHDETVGFLTAIHRHIVHQFHRHLVCVNAPPRLTLPTPPPPLKDFTQMVPVTWQPHSEFQTSFRKKAALTVGEIHQMMLMQVPRLGRATVSNVAASFPTMASLWTHVRAGKDVDLRSSTRRVGEQSHTFLMELCRRPSYAPPKA